MNSSNDPVNFLSCTILGLKTALFEAEKENRNLQKLLLSFYVKDAAKETNLYKMNRSGAKMNEVFQKEKQDLSLKIQELEEKLSESEKENLNLNFQIRELQAFLEEKTNLLELYNPKSSKSGKPILNTFKEKELVQIIRNVLTYMKNSRVSRELQKSLKKIEQRRNKLNIKKIKFEDTDPELSDDEVDLMSAMIENQLKDDECSIKHEKNDSPSFQPVQDGANVDAIDLKEIDVADTETNSSHINECIPIEQSIFSPFSIADSDYSSNGVKSVESVNLEKVPSAEPIHETDPLPAEQCVQETEPTLVVAAVDIIQSDDSVSDEEEPTLAAASVDIIQSDDSVSDEEEVLKYSDIPFLEPEIENSVVHDILKEMNNVSHSNAIVQSYEEFCKNVDRLNLALNVSISEKNTDKSHTCESTPGRIVLPVPQDLNREPLPFKRKTCASSQNSNFKKMRLKRDSSNASVEKAEIGCVIEENQSAEKIPSLQDVTSEKVQHENARNMSGPSILKNIVQTNSLSALRDENSVSRNMIIEDEPEITNKPIQADLMLPNPGVNSDLSLSPSNKLAFEREKCVETARGVRVEIEMETLNSGPEASNNCSVETRIVQKSPRASIFDVETDITAFETVLDPVTPVDKEVSACYDVNEEVSACHDDDLTEFAKNKSSDDKGNSDVIPVDDQLTKCAENNSPLDFHEEPDETLSPSTDHFDEDTDSREKQDLSTTLDNCCYDKSSTIVDHRNDDRVSENQGKSNAVMNDSSPNLTDDASGKITEKSFVELRTEIEECSEEIESNVNPKKDFAKVSVTTDSGPDAILVTNENSDSGAVSVTNENSGSHVEQMEDTEPACNEEPELNKEIPIHEAEKMDLFCILNEFAVLEEQMRKRIAVFKEFLLQEKSEPPHTLSEEVCDKTEYIVVAEILNDGYSEFFDRRAFLDGSSLPDDVICSLDKTRLKTVELPTSLENLDVHYESHSPQQQLFIPLSNSMAEANDSSDDEKDELTIVEDDCISNIPIEDPASHSGGVIPNEEKRELVSNNVTETVISNSIERHSILKENQPIKEITNIPRYNFRRVTTSSPSADETCSTLVETSVNSSERDSDSVESAVEEPLKTVKMKFYMENQTTADDCSLYIPVFDEVWSKIKLNCFENSSRGVPNTSDLIPCPSTVLNLVFSRKYPTDLKQEEDVSDLPVVKKLLEEFLKEKIRNHAIAFNAFSMAVCHSNKTTLCRAITELLSNSVNANNSRIQENTSRDLVNLSVKLESSVFPGLVEALKNYLKSIMWTKSWNGKQNSASLVVYLRLFSKFYTKLCKLNNDSCSVVSLLRESLFSFRFRGHPIAFSALSEWPEVFPKDAEQRSLIAHIILFCLINHRMDYNQNLYNVEELRQLISTLYEVRLGMKAAEEYAKELMLQFNDDSWYDAITLLCKRQQFPWTYTNVIMRYLLPILRKWNTEQFSEEVLIKTLNALRTLMNACPHNKKENGIYKLDLIVQTLNEVLTSDKGSRESKETVMLNLCDLTSVRFQTCAEILSKWQPADEVIRRSTFEQLKDRINQVPSNKWPPFFNAKRNYSNTRENKHGGINKPGGMNRPGGMNTHGGVKRLNGFRGNLRPRDDNSLIAVGITKKFMNKNGHNSEHGKKKKKNKKKSKKK